MQKSKISRWSLKGSAAVLALAGTFTAAQAYETKFGEVSIVFDTTVSMGASMLTAERNTEFLPEANGGPVDPRAANPIAGLSGNKTTFSGSTGSIAYTNNGYNFDGSLNADDGRLNFDQGDLIGANVKATHDFQATWQNYKIFARATGFYDVVMNDENAGDHSQLTDQALGDVGRNYELLDAFVSADYTVGDLPVNLRVGKQVINWGESTFIQNGLNVFNPIDVAAIRKPGSEIKEALVPVNSVFASVSFPFQVGLSGWYALDFEPFELDPSGTPFSTADSVAFGSGIGGNNSYSFVTSSPFGANRRACNASAATQAVWAAGFLNNPTGGVLGNDLLECDDSMYVSSSQRLPNNQHELIRLGQINGTGGQVDLSGDGVSVKTTGVLSRGKDYLASDDGQFGIKATWFAEELNGTEFGFYYQNYHSRLPFVFIEGTNKADSEIADLGFSLSGANTELVTGLSSNALHPIGCGLAWSGNPALDGGPGQIQGQAKAVGSLTAAIVTANAQFAGAISSAAQAKMKSTEVKDDGGLLSAAATALGLLTIDPDGAGPLTNTLYNAGGSIGYRNQYAVAQLNCVLAYYQSAGVAGIPGVPFSIAQVMNNSEFLVASKEAQLSVTYPEDVEVFGFSFNTTVGSWGVQAEATYRPDAPFQVDTDSLTIAALANGCIFQQLRGWAGSQVIEPLVTPDGSGIKGKCGNTSTVTNPIIRNEMFTAQVGTTAQFTGSDWFIDMLSADIGTFVTEVGMVYTPGVEDTWISNGGAAYAQYQNTGCQGTDLPLGSILDLDVKRSDDCRPTNVSAGLVMLFSWQYNNFMDSGFGVSPRIVYSYDFEGTTAAPYGNYVEDRQALNLGIDGTLNNNLRVGVSYSNFFGGHVNNKSSDRDFASVTASYSF